MERGLGHPMTPTIPPRPSRAALLARTKEAHHKTGFSRRVDRAIVAEQGLKKQDITALRFQFDPRPKIQRRDLFIQIFQVLVLDRVGCGQVA